MINRPSSTPDFTSWPISISQAGDWDYALSLIVRFQESGLTHAPLFEAFDTAKPKIVKAVDDARATGVKGISVLINGQQVVLKFGKEGFHEMRNPFEADAQWEYLCEYLASQRSAWNMGADDIWMNNLEIFNPSYSLWGRTMEEYTQQVRKRVAQLREACGSRALFLNFYDSHKMSPWEGWPAGSGDKPLPAIYNANEPEFFRQSLDALWCPGDPLCVSFSYSSPPGEKGTMTWDEGQTLICGRMVEGQVPLVVEYPGFAFLSNAKNLFDDWAGYADYWERHMQAFLRGIGNFGCGKM